MALIRLNNQSISSVTTLPSGIDVGKVGQVISVHNTTEFTTTSSSYVDVTNFTASITPSSTSSKVLIIATVVARTGYGGGTNSETALKLLRGSTDLHEMSPFIRLAIGNGEPDISMTGSAHNYLDSPSTTSATTYKYQTRQITSGTAGFDEFNLTLMEVLA